MTTTTTTYQCIHLEHIEEDVEFDDGLSSHNVVHHGHVHILDQEVGPDENDALQEVTHLSRLHHTTVLRQPINNHSTLVGQMKGPALLFSYHVFANLTQACLALPFYLFVGQVTAKTKFKTDWPIHTISAVMGALQFVVCIYHSQTTWKKKKKWQFALILYSDLLKIFSSIYMALALYHLEEISQDISHAQ